ncbi:bifunctional hydroxy-methylpyrimidine kinase/ hydroxy-phosphomethylpyrimidine kinase [Vibrio cholerae]|nr:bifunctional hydroxy-methylpyrimidine kinase/ hydroxy-phosphomethylpyrimidine kinase [Vibrio cholerae]
MGRYTIFIYCKWLKANSDDLLIQSGDSRYFCAPRIATKNTHGTGCSLSSAIASYLAQGAELVEAGGFLHSTERN